MHVESCHISVLYIVWKALNMVLKLIISVFSVKGSKYSDKIDRLRLYCDVLEHITPK